MNPVTADFEPPLQEIKLSAFSRPINPFHDHKGARILPLRHGGFG
jgi:hypothetical protein